MLLWNGGFFPSYEERFDTWLVVGVVNISVK
ncbi:hypothetical protein AT2G07000 [Arabidopsis thaliana]|uniref:Uncharacterized protein At2g07000 n=1 Tax=Arabidopsis thaliana TaxID=3702 RepID=Q9ZVW1_ARATH|nr:uncharacterized protein AT2G07000 [Arabidopsis thaliana]AAC67204.1 unknown protein [Arabidopsis thaliana]AEC06029.1 hypothetical protein AT2G07000 [Arabidopsis thaliana]|eukprot:NP_178717.1 hypothetical protein AT2G07000 [Arabidopsis thaliana]